MSTLPSGLPDFVEDSEPLAGFLFSSNSFSREVVKPSAFLPNPRDGERSVFRHGAAPLTALWEIGDSLVREQRNLHGVAIIKAGDVRVAALSAVASEPPLRHGAIRNWAINPNDPDLQKSRQKQQAMELARAGGGPLLRWPPP